MTNPYYNHSTWPATSSAGSSALARAEMDAIAAGFALLPTLSGQAGTHIMVNSGGSALTNSLVMVETANLITITGGLTVSGTLTPNGAMTVAGAFTATNNATSIVSQAVKLQTPRLIGGTSFDGTANIAIALAATATALATPRTINGVSFDGTGNITVADATKLPLTGGTLTGALTANTTTQLIATFNSTHASKGYVQWQMGGAAEGYVGDAVALAAGGAGNFCVRAEAGLQLAYNAGTVGLTLDTSGNVALGTTATDSASFGKTLDIVGPAATGAAIYVRANGVAATTYALLGVDTSGNAYLLNKSNANLYFYTNNVQRLAITGTGVLQDASGNPFTPIQRGSKAATTSRISTTTLTNDPDLAVSLSAGTWAIDLKVPVWATATTTMGVKWQLAFSGTLTNSALTSAGFISGAAVLAGMLAIGSSLVTQTGVAVAAGGNYITMSGTITVSVAGTLSFQWAQNASTADNLNMGVGGYLSCTKVA